MRRKVLIVEDDRAARVGLAQMISRQGHKAIVADSFEQGRQLLRTERPDLLITDVRLGDFNGLQLIVGQTRSIPAIVMTAYEDPVIEAEARKAGAYYVVKPLPPNAFLALVDAALADREQDGEYQVSRQWRRKPISGGLPARVDELSATVRDVSYGGLRLQVEGSEERLPSSFTVTLPGSEVNVPVELVWQNRTDEGALECGVALSMMNHSMRSAWLDLVDSIG